jgi:multicomponent K+:H+ antiporter subunit E
MMRRLLPHPLLSVCILSMWLLLQSSLAPGTLLVGALLGVLAPFAMRALEPERPKVGAPLRILELVAVVLRDVVRSNYAVASILLGRRGRDRVSGFVRIKLELRDRYGLAALAIILTMTPGTLWVQYDAATGTLLLHVFDLLDEDEWRRLVKERYESRLTEIFE